MECTPAFFPGKILLLPLFSLKNVSLLTPTISRILITLGGFSDRGRTNQKNYEHHIYNEIFQYNLQKQTRAKSAKHKGFFVHFANEQIPFSWHVQKWQKIFAGKTLFLLSRSLRAVSESCILRITTMCFTSGQNLPSAHKKKLSYR